MIKALEKKYLKEDLLLRPFVENIKIENKITFSKDNIYFFGNYDDNVLDTIKKKINNNKRNILKAVERGIKFIIYGNSIELFNNSFKSSDINLFTSYNKKNKFVVIDDIKKGINTYNFRYKNLICISDLKSFKKYKKKTKHTTLSY